MRSELVGTAALWIALAAAIVVSFSRSRAQSQTLIAALPIYLVVVALQCLHFAEEFVTGFQRRFPQRFDLEPWPDSFFVIFNAICICVWVLAGASISAGRTSRVVGVAVWFLTFGAIGNGIAHPVLAIASGGYFPGLITAPVLGFAGVVPPRVDATTLRLNEELRGCGGFVCFRPRADICRTVRFR